MLGVATCVDRLEQALAIVGEPRAHAMIAIRLGAVLVHQGRREEAAALLRGTLDGLGSDDADLAEEVALAYIGVALLEAEWTADARQRLRQIHVASERPAHLQRALLLVSQLDGILELRAAQDAAALAAADMAAWRDRRFWMGGAEPWHHISCLVWADELAQAERACSSVVAAATAQGSAVSHARARAARAPVRYWSGRLAAATDDANAAWDGSCRMPSSWRQEAAAWLCLCHIERDDASAGAEILRELDGKDDDGVREPGAGMLAVARARLALDEGSGAQALELLESAGRALSPVTRNPAILPWRSEAAMAAIRLGDQALARAHATEELALARRFGAPRPIGVALRAAGLAAGGAEGLDLLRASVHVLERSPAALERARTLATLGGELRRQGHRCDARDVLRAALGLAESFGARRLQREVRDELAAAGARPRRRDASGPGALTPGELRVAQLAARGRTNRQIAGELFVTDKAVQWHLRHVYRKLGVSRRQDLPDPLRQ
jgi:DNA-binding CsgD family transcriptional regulator